MKVEMKVDRIVKYFASLLFSLFVLVIVSIIILNLKEPPEVLIKKLFQSDFLKSWLVFIPAMVLLYVPKVEKSKFIVFLVNINLPILNLIFVVEEFSRQIPMIDIFKWGSVVILSYNVFFYYCG